MGVLLSTYVSRIPSITKMLDVTTGRLALLMLTGAVGALAALTVTGWVVARFGTRAVLFWTSHLSRRVSDGRVVYPHRHRQWWFAIGQFFVSFAFAFTNVAMNAEAANVERWMRRAVMPHFHASFSIGMATGLAFGALVRTLVCRRRCTSLWSRSCDAFGSRSSAAPCLWRSQSRRRCRRFWWPLQDGARRVPRARASCSSASSCSRPRPSRAPPPSGPRSRWCKASTPRRR